MNDLDFVAFFRDIHGVPPFPWQERLARQLIETGTWPDLIDLPTASGKTACIDIALFHLAWCLERGERGKAARRIVFVVDRRIIVDATARRAERIRDALRNPPTDAVRAVANALMKAGGSEPLVCQELRGGMPRERGIALNPAQPMVITSTVDQVGSRLLFRGYGVNPYSWPVHAGLLGFDTLILLDEAHLSAPFAETVAAIQREQSRAEKSLAPVQPVRFVSLSATAHTERTPFGLVEEDFSNPVIRERRTAPKPARLVEVPRKPADRVKALFRETLDTYKTLSGEVSPAVAVIVNRVRTARLLFEQFRELAEKEGFTVELLTGRCRPLDRDDIVKRVIERCGAGREPRTGEPGLIVVATQTLEVGADLDFQGLVTECASLDALRQRFGRLDRLGRFRRARGVVVGSADDKDDPIYGPALSATWEWLCEKARREGDALVVDFSIEAMDRLLQGVDISSMTTRSGELLQLTPLHVELLAQTSPTPAYDPDVEALLHGVDRGLRDVQVVWRADLPVIVRDDRAVLDTRELSAASALLRTAPPVSLEAMNLPLHVVRAWLKGEKDTDSMADVEGASASEVEEDSGSPGLTRQALRWQGEKWETVFARQLRAGDTIVVPTEYGGCDEYGFSPESTDPVRDLSARARSALKRSPVVILTKRLTEAPEVANIDAARDAWTQLAKAYEEPDFDPEEHLPALLDALGDEMLSSRGWPITDPEIATVADRDGKLYALIVTSRRPMAGDFSEEDNSSSQTVPVTLPNHSAGVGQRVRELTRACGLSQELQDTVARAGDLHDLGKADPRFQQFLRGGDLSILPGEILAKGPRRIGRSSVELGERHEAYSVALVRRHRDLLGSVTDAELAEYLVGTHHGRGRPLMPDRSDEGVAFAVEVDGHQLQYEGVPRLSALASGWATLFWRLNRRYGAWGLAYLETILRLADWLQSAEEVEKGRPR